ncbi:hypothetical protein PG999_005398 [Apiospora kogelbergensis]|uniref:Uncharacterized protein n=1 Tax=Apiospora kogelbergensis TaxID=1337665 RepID=A0AAW0R234_9PEZI
MKTARIFTYDWNASLVGPGVSQNRLADHARALLNSISGEREKTALVTCSQAWQAENQPVLDYTVGIIFLGTPFHGTAEAHQNATELRLVLESAARNTTAAHLAEYVGKGEDAQATLHEVVADFSHLIRLERANISVICYHETQMTDYSSIASTLPESFRERLDKNNRATFVTPVSASLLGCPSYSLDKKHSTLNKYHSPSDPAFQEVVRRLKKMEADAPAELKRRES